MEKAEERRQLRAYIIRALNTDENCFHPGRTRTKEEVIARHLYSFYCAMLELNPAAAAIELEFPTTLFISFKYHAARIMKHTKKTAEIYSEACRRIQLQLSDPENDYTFPELYSNERNLATRARRDREFENAGYPVSVRYKSKDGYINHHGEIVLRP